MGNSIEKFLENGRNWIEFIFLEGSCPPWLHLGSTPVHSYANWYKRSANEFTAMNSLADLI